MSAAACAEVDPERWDETLRAAGVTDVYYTRGYVAASATLLDAEPVLLRLAGDGGEVLFACLLRREPADVVTPYGYGGPIGAGDDPPLADFPAAYEAWCEARGVQKMVEEDRYCIDVLTQISAIQAALDKVALGLLDDHVKHCVVEGHGPGTPDELTDEMMGAIGRLIGR